MNLVPFVGDIIACSISYLNGLRSLKRAKATTVSKNIIQYHFNELKQIF